MIGVTESLAGLPRTPVIYLEGRLPVLEAPAAAGLDLHDGQVVRPTVESRDGGLMLWLQGQAIPVPPQLRLAAGEQPWWQVRVDAGGRVTLQPLAGGPPADDAAGAAAHAAPLLPDGRLGQLALRPQTLQGLLALMQPGALSSLFEAAPQASVAPLVAQLLRLWPQTSQLGPELLRRWLRVGGWTQEAQLARGRVDPEGAVDGPDLKSLLRDLLAGWDQAPQGTRALLHEALDDIESGQLQTVVDAGAGREMVLSMVLPFADAEPVDVRWRRESRGQGAGRERSPWVIDLHTRSSVMGEVWLRTRVSEGSKVELAMWAERAELVERARASSASLAAWLNEAGLRMMGLQVVHGAPPAPVQADQQGQRPAGAPGRLVDVKA